MLPANGGEVKRMAIQLPTAIGPIPGDPAGIRARANKFTRTADAILEAVRGLQTAIADTRNHSSEALDELAENAGDVSSHLDSLHNRYQVAGEALSGFATALETAQSQVGPLIQESSQSEASVHYYDRQIDIYDDRRHAATDPTELAEINTHLAGLHRRRNSQVADIANARARFEQIVESLRQAGIAAANRLQTATSSDGFNDTLWDDFTGWVAEHAEILKALRTVLSWVTAALSVLSFFFPVLAPFALAAALLTAGLSLVLALSGEISWVDFALDVIAALSFGVGALAVRGVSRVLTMLKTSRVAHLTSLGGRSPLRSVTGSFNGVLRGRNGLTIGNLRLPSVPWIREVLTARGTASAHFLRIAASGRAGAGGPMDAALLGLGHLYIMTSKLANGIGRTVSTIDTGLDSGLPTFLDVLPDAMSDNAFIEWLSDTSQDYQDFRDDMTWRVGS